MGKHHTWAVRLVLAAGVVYTLALQAVAPSQEVFFSGDGGEKALQMRQYAAGRFHADLRLSDDPWTLDLWKQGLFPGDLTFFQIDGRTYSIFPFTFPFVTAPLYAAFGVRGLYLVPLLSVWCLWLVMACALRRIDPNPLCRAALLGAFIFACPLTLYAAIYWEHPVAAALSFVGLQFALRSPAGNGSVWHSALYGIALGSAGWFREECIVFAAIVLSVSFVHARRSLGNAPWIAYCIGTAGTIAAYVAANLWIYGSLLGTHALQKKLDVDLARRLYNAAVWSFDMYSSFLYSVPIVLMGAGLLAALLRMAPKRVDRESWSLLAIVLLSFVATGLIVPSHGDYQIGPRFLFPVVPICWLLIATWWREVLSLGVPLLRVGFACVFVGVLAMGVKRNAVDGAAILAENYRARVAPALELVLARPETTVAVANQAITQELSVAMHQKRFFMAKTPGQLQRLVEALRERGEMDFVYIAFGDELSEIDSPIREAEGLRLTAEPLGRFGSHFYVYAVRLAP